MYSLEGKQLTREEVRVIAAEAHVWQKCADLRGTDLCKTNLIGADLRETDLEGATFSGARLDNAIEVFFCLHLLVSAWGASLNRVQQEMPMPISAVLHVPSRSDTYMSD